MTIHGFSSLIWVYDLLKDVTLGLDSIMPKYIECKNWKCGKCQYENRNSRSAKCGRCGESKEKGYSQDVLRGDWICKKCKINNFARRQDCYKCKAPRK